METEDSEMTETEEGKEPAIEISSSVPTRPEAKSTEMLYASESTVSLSFNRRSSPAIATPLLPSVKLVL